MASSYSFSSPYGKTFGDFGGPSLTQGGWGLFVQYGGPSAPAPAISQPIVNVTPVTPTFDPKLEANALYGKAMALFVGGFARIGASPAPIVGPYINAGTVDFIVSFGVPANVTGDRKIYAIYLDNELAWYAASGGTLPVHGTFTSEAFDFIFKPGTLTQTICSLETTHFPGDECAYRPMMLLQITGLPYARFMEITGKPVPYVACDIGDVTDGADPLDGINIGEAWERVAYSPWAGYTSSTAEAVNTTDVVDAGLFKDNFTVIDVGKNTNGAYKNIDILVSDKVRLKDRGSNVSPDFIFDRDNIIADDPPIRIFRAGATAISRELELLAIDPDQDYTIVPSLSKHPRDPVAVSVSRGKETITLPWVINANTRQALAVFAQQHQLNAIKRIAFKATAEAYEVEPGDLIAVIDMGNGTDNEVFKVTQTSHNGDFTVDIEGEAILRCALYSSTPAESAFRFGDQANPAEFTADVGEPSDDRLVIVVTSGLRIAVGPRTITDVLINGVSATIHGQIQSNIGSPAVVSGIASLVVPTGTTVDVEIQFDGVLSGVFCGVYTLTGYSSATPYDIKSDFVTTGDPTVSLDVPIGGSTFVFTNWFRSLTPGAITFSGVSTEDADENYEIDFSSRLACAHQSNMNAEIGRTISSNAPTMSDGDAMIIAASWG